MRILSKTPLSLQGNEGEDITVKVSATGTVFAIACRVKNNSFVFTSPLTFRLERAVRNPTVLTMHFTYSSSSGGIYDIEISGSPGTDVLTQTIKQSGNMPDRAVAYAFVIV